MAAIVHPAGAAVERACRIRRECTRAAAVRWMRVSGLRSIIGRQVHGLVGFGSGEIDLDRGDAGLFGPGSVSWTVHCDFTAMMIGGVGALLLQMLHPGALAGVWDHSDFRADMLGRLRRTAQFVAGTTYGSTDQAERLIARVRSIHDRVAGSLPDGTPYSANDPALLTWVHVAEAYGFLAAHLRYRDPAMARSTQDRYFAETAEVARRLGATDVPVSRTAVEAYLTAMRPRLAYDGRTREVAAALMAQPAPSRLTGPLRSLTMAAGADLLPHWAARMHGFPVHDPRRPLVRHGVRGMGLVLRWALTDGAARRARRRTGGGDTV